MPPATPKTMRGADELGVAEGIGEGVQVTVGVLASLLDGLGLEALVLEFFGVRTVEEQLAFEKLFHGEGERLVRERRHLRRDEGTVARSEAVVVLVDLSGPDGRDCDEGELGVADLAEQVLDGGVD